MIRVNDRERVKEERPRKRETEAETEKERDRGRDRKKEGVGKVKIQNWHLEYSNGENGGGGSMQIHPSTYANKQSKISIS